MVSMQKSVQKSIEKKVKRLVSGQAWSKKDEAIPYSLQTNLDESFLWSARPDDDSDEFNRDNEPTQPLIPKILEEDEDELQPAKPPSMKRSNSTSLLGGENKEEEKPLSQTSKPTSMKRRSSFLGLRSKDVEVPSQPAKPPSLTRKNSFHRAVLQKVTVVVTKTDEPAPETVQLEATPSQHGVDINNGSRTGHRSPSNDKLSKSDHMEKQSFRKVSLETQYGDIIAMGGKSRRRASMSAVVQTEPVTMTTTGSSGDLNGDVGRGTKTSRRSRRDDPLSSHSEHISSRSPKTPSKRRGISPKNSNCSKKPSSTRKKLGNHLGRDKTEKNQVWSDIDDSSSCDDFAEDVADDIFHSKKDDLSLICEGKAKDDQSIRTSMNDLFLSSHNHDNTINKSAARKVRRKDDLSRSEHGTRSTMNALPSSQRMSRSRSPKRETKSTRKSLDEATRCRSKSREGQPTRKSLDAATRSRSKSREGQPTRKSLDAATRSRSKSREGQPTRRSLDEATRSRSKSPCPYPSMKSLEGATCSRSKSPCPYPAGEKTDKKSGRRSSSIGKPPVSQRKSDPYQPLQQEKQDVFEVVEGGRRLEFMPSPLMNQYRTVIMESEQKSEMPTIPYAYLEDDIEED